MRTYLNRLHQPYTCSHLMANLMTFEHRMFLISLTMYTHIHTYINRCHKSRTHVHMFCFMSTLHAYMPMNSNTLSVSRVCMYVSCYFHTLAYLPHAHIGKHEYCNSVCLSLSLTLASMLQLKATTAWRFCSN